MRNDPRENLLNIHRRHVKAWEQKNLDRFRDLYADQITIFHTGPPPRFSDFNTFENTLQQYFSKMQEVAFLTSNIQIEVFGEVAWITSLYLMAYQRNGQLRRENGRWTEIYQRIDQDWKLIHLHASPDPSQR
ncbi:MAG: YybH family protein [Acidobacteriota bacterium]